MDNQENWEETQEFDLDSILSEFGSGAVEEAPQAQPEEEDGDVKEYIPSEPPARPEENASDLDRNGNHWYNGRRSQHHNPRFCFKHEICMAKPDDRSGG